MSHDTTRAHQSIPVARRVLFAFDAFELDPQRLELRHAGVVQKVDPLALRLLAALLERDGGLVTKQELFAQVWGGRAVSDNVLTVAMARLRRALALCAADIDMVSNVFGRGYRFLRTIERRETKLEPFKAKAEASIHGKPWIGREQVMTAMCSLLDGVISGRGHALIVSGEAGIGKTRSIEELTYEAATKSVPVIWAYCRERGTSPPLWPFAQLIRGALAKGRLDARDERVRRWLGELSHLIPELDLGLDSQVARAHGHAELPAKHRLFDAITQLLLQAATPQPLVLVLDDIHQADDASIDLLRYLVDEIAHASLLLLASVRTSQAGSSSSAGLRPLLAHRNCTWAPLERLSEQAVMAYVAATLREDGERATGLGRAIFVKSEGNPFFMHELLRQVEAAPHIEAGALQASNAALELARQRLRELDDRSIEVLACAAVIGRCFELPLLQAVTQLDMSTLMARLEAACGCDVLEPAPDSRTAFVFDHELLRDALYEQLTPTKRRSLHRAVAEALTQRTQACGTLGACTLAHHLYAALPECDLRGCVQQCIDAAEEAGQAHAYADGARYLAHAREALELLPDGSPRLRLKLLFGQAVYARAHAGRDCERVVHELLQLARAQNDAVMLARAVLLLDLHTGFPPLPGSQSALEEALAKLPETEPALRAALLARRATTAAYAYDAERSAKQVEAALALVADAQAPYARYSALNAQLYLRGGPVYAAETEARLLELQALCQRHPRLYSLPPALFELHRAIAAQQAGDLTAQDAALLRCEKLTCGVGSRELLWHCQRFAALALINAGQLARGKAALEALHRRAEHEVLGGARLLCAYDQTIVFEHAPASERAVLPDATDAPSVWSTKVRVLAALGDLRAAYSALSLVRADQLRRLPCDRDYLGTLGALAHASIALCARDYAATLYQLLEPYEGMFAAHIAFYCEGSVATLRGMLARSAGDEARAETHLMAGIASCERAGLKTSAQRARRELSLLRRS